MNNKALVWVGIAVVVILAIFGIYYLFTANSPAGTSGGEASSTSATVQPLPPGAVIEVPGQGEANVSSGVAVPSLVASGSVSGDTSYRSFDLAVSASAFTPGTIIVNQGDTVHINLTANGGSYDFTQPDLGFGVAVAAGKTRTVQFDANEPGKFTFYCASCGGPSKGPVGYLEVVAH